MYVNPNRERALSKKEIEQADRIFQYVEGLRTTMIKRSSINYSDKRKKKKSCNLKEQHNHFFHNFYL